MNDILTIWSAGASLASVAFAHLWLRSRDLARDLAADLEIERGVTKSLEHRVNTLRGDNITLSARNEANEKKIADLLAELYQLDRKIGRMEAEQRAAKPKRGPDGRFISKPKATVTPIRCG